jgi:molybdopterin-dependent oxidoreductase alpha subunit
MKKQMPNPENPEVFRNIKKSKPVEVAAGPAAVGHALGHVLREMDAFRGLKVLNNLNQKDGIDCPGCAWPDPDDERSGFAEYCENGAKAVAEEATTKRLTAEFFAQNSVVDLAKLDDFDIGKKGRVAQPMHLKEGATHYTPISWDAAFALITKHLVGLDSPDEALFYTSGRTSNEAAFLYQLLVRAYGTNNLPDCSNMCHESSGVALNESLGIGKGSVKLEDFYEAEVIMILGQNPGTNHPRMMSALQRAKRNGAKIISINPLKEAGLMAFANPQEVSGMLGAATQLTDLYLQVVLNGDLALLKALNTLLVRADDAEPAAQVLDHAFMQAHTQGAETYMEHLRGQEVGHLAKLAGLSMAEVEEAAAILKPAQKIIVCWAMGLTQHKNAVDTIREIVNLLLLKGSIGKPGAGTCPVRGHSNVQGDRTMGIYEKPPQAFLDRLEQSFGFRPPQHHGYDVVEAIEAMQSGKAKVFLAMGGNFLSATPDTLYTAHALQKCDLTVQISTKLNRSHLITGKEALILPALGRTDLDNTGGQSQFVSVENSMGVVHLSQGKVRPVSDQLMSEVEMVCKLGQCLAAAQKGDTHRLDWQLYASHYDHVRSAIERTIPGFEDFNNRVRVPGGFYLPNCSRDGFAYKTPTGKAYFQVAEPIEQNLQPTELMMMTIRSHDQFNTTIYGLDDRYRGIRNERRVILMHPDDIAERGLKPDDVVDIFNYHGGRERVARKFIVIAYEIPRRCVATYFPETNVLVPIQSTADKSNTPVSKLVIVEVKASLC